ncbi:LOW QUALITY PROTEIN: hypothetical protein CRUP_012642, partial [Coryphaenoides rupestris]
KIQADLAEVRRRTDQILKTGEQGGGVPGVSDKRIRELEEKLKEVQDLISRGGEDNERVQQLIGQSIDDLRAEIALTDGRLMGVSGDLNSLATEDAALRSTLDHLEGALRDINATLAKKRQTLDDYLTSGFTEQFEKVKRYYRESLEAEQRCNASVVQSHRPAQSRDTRQRTEDLLDARKARFHRTIAAQNKSLEGLRHKARDLNKKVHHLSHKVCGGHGIGDANGSCPHSRCGGAGCRDDAGAPACGGDGCNGTTSSSLAALQLARDAGGNITKAGEDLQDVARKLQAIATLAQDVKNQAKHTLDKAQKKKAQFDISNKELKDFIKKIKDFLTEEGADPESIEKVSLHVLSITLPLNQTGLERMLGEMKDRLANLSDVQGVFNQSQQDIARAHDLLGRAKTAKKRADGVKDKTDLTKQALDISQKAIGQAQDALRDALNNVDSTRNATEAVEEVLQQLELGQMEAMMRLANLSAEVDALRNKTDANRLMAHHARELADNATLLATSLEQGLNQTEERYRELKEKLAPLEKTGGLDWVNQKAKDMKKEAEDLLSTANKSIDRLKMLEKKFRKNEQRMQRQQDELAELERSATSAREDIRAQVHKYSNC